MNENGTRQQNDLSRSKVNQPQGHGVGLWGNPRIVVGIRIDSGLYAAFKPVAQAVFGSVCRSVEGYIAAILSAGEIGVNFGKTIDIKNIVIERNLRPRRKLEIRGDEDEIVGHMPYVVNQWSHRSEENKRVYYEVAQRHQELPVCQKVIGLYEAEHAQASADARAKGSK